MVLLVVLVNQPELQVCVIHITGGCGGSLRGVVVLSIFSPTHSRHTAGDEGARPQP